MKNYTAILLLLMMPQFARATLGEKIDSVARDRGLISARQKSLVSHATYTVSEIESDATTVKEYADTDGKVFAITWQGHRHPDLSALLGTYFEDYQAASKKSKRMLGRRKASVSTNKVVVEHWGHMRDLHGRAYDPNLVPGGVSINEIQ